MILLFRQLCELFQKMRGKRGPLFTFSDHSPKSAKCVVWKNIPQLVKELLSELKNSEKHVSSIILFSHKMHNVFDWTPSPPPPVCSHWSCRHWDLSWRRLGCRARVSCLMLGPPGTALPPEENDRCQKSNLGWDLEAKKHRHQWVSILLTSANVRALCLYFEQSLNVTILVQNVNPLPV